MAFRGKYSLTAARQRCSGSVFWRTPDAVGHLFLAAGASTGYRISVGTLPSPLRRTRPPGTASGRPPAPSLATFVLALAVRAVESLSGVQVECGVWQEVPADATDQAFLESKKSFVVDGPVGKQVSLAPRWDHARRAAAGVKFDGTPAPNDRANNRQIPGFLHICGLTSEAYPHGDVVKRQANPRSFGEDLRLLEGDVGGLGM